MTNEKAFQAATMSKDDYLYHRYHHHNILEYSITYYSRVEYNIVVV